MDISRDEVLQHFAVVMRHEREVPLRGEVPGFAGRQCPGEILGQGGGQNVVGESLPETDTPAYVLEPQIPGLRDQRQLPGGPATTLAQRFRHVLSHDRTVTGIGKQVAVGRVQSGHHEAEVPVTAEPDPGRDEVSGAACERGRARGQRQQRPVAPDHSARPVPAVERAEGADEYDLIQASREVDGTGQRIGRTRRHAHDRESWYAERAGHGADVGAPLADAAPGLERGFPEARAVNGEEPHASPAGGIGHHPGFEPRAWEAVKVEYRWTVRIAEPEAGNLATVRETNSILCFAGPESRARKNTLQIDHERILQPDLGRWRRPRRKAPALRPIPNTIGRRRSRELMVNAPFAIRGIDHVVLRAREPERLVAFYRDVLGCPVEREQPHIGLTQLRAGLCLIDVVAQSALAGAPDDVSGVHRNLDHLCLIIEPFDTDGLAAYLRGQGVPVGNVALRYGAEGEGPSLYLQDPEGNGIELKAPVGARKRG